MMHENLSQEAEFLDAVQSGDVSKVQAFLDENPQMAFPPELIGEAVGIAAEAGNEDLVTLLVEAQAQRTAVAAAEQLQTQLPVGAEPGAGAAEIALAPAPSAPPPAASLTTSPFIDAVQLDAVQSGDVSKVQAFLDENPQMAFPPELIGEAVGIAAEAGNEDLVTLLVEAQAQRTAVAAAEQLQTQLPVGAEPGAGAAEIALAPAPSAPPPAASLTTSPFIDAVQLDAVQSGDVSKVQAFLDENPQMAFPPELIGEAVGIAAEAGNEDLVTLLVEAQAQRTALAQAASAHTAAQSSDPQQAFLNAVWEDNLRFIEDLISRIPTIINEARGDQGETALHLAVFYGRPVVVQFLLAAGADVQATDFGGNTASALSGYPPPPGTSQDDRATCALLLEQHLATAGSAASAVASGLPASPFPVSDAPEPEAVPPAFTADQAVFFFSAVEDSDVEDIRTLLSKNPQLIQARNAKGRSALFLAVQSGISKYDDYAVIVSMLLKHIENSLVLDVKAQEVMLLEVLELYEAPCIHLIQEALEKLAESMERASISESSTAPALTTAVEGNAALYKAAPSGNLDVFGQIVPGVYAALCDNRTNLHTVFEIAAKASSKSNVDFLHGLATNMLEDPRPESIALMVAVYQNNPEAIKRAFESGADISLKDKDDNSLLMVAAHMNHVECIISLLHPPQMADHTINLVEAKGSHGENALMIAASKGKLEAFNLLFEATNAHQDGAGASLIDQEGHSVLMAAAHGGNVEVIKTLLQDRSTQLAKQGSDRSWFSSDTPPAIHSDPALCSKSGQTALHLAAQQGNSACVQALLAERSEEEKVKCVFQRDSAGPKVKNARDFAAEGLFLAAAEHGDDSGIQALLARDPNLITLRNDAGQSAVALAATRGQDDCIAVLMNHIDPLPEEDQENLRLDMNIREVVHGQDDSSARWDAYRGCSARWDAYRRCVEALDTVMTPSIQALCTAATQSDQEELQSLLDQGIDPNVPDEQGERALMYAAGEGKIECVRALIAAKANLNVRNADGNTALICAAREGKIDCVRALIAAKADLDVRNADGATALICAAREGKIDCVRALIAAKADLDVRNADGATALICAAREGKIECVRALIAAKADLDVRNADGATALICAARETQSAKHPEGKIECVRALIAAKADLDATTERGETALMFVAFAGKIECVRALIAENATPHVQSKTGSTALICAAAGGHTDVVRALLKAGAELDLHREEGDTALMYAADGGHADIVQALLKAGAHPNLKMKQGETALMHAALGLGKAALGLGKEVDSFSATIKVNSFSAIIKALLEAGADPTVELDDQEPAPEATSEAAPEAAPEATCESLKVVLSNQSMCSNLLRSVLNQYIQTETEELWRLLLPHQNTTAPLPESLLIKLNQLMQRECLKFDAVDEAKGNTLLMCAVEAGNIEVVKALLEGQCLCEPYSGTEVIDHLNAGKETALMMAIQRGQKEIVTLLLKQGAKMNIGSGVKPALQVADEYHRPELKVLLQNYSRDQLSAAIQSTHVDRISALIDQGCDVNASDPEGKSMLMLAVAKGEPEIVNLLIASQADVNARDSEDKSVLMLAVEKAEPDIVELLLASQADVNACDSDDKSMLMLAVAKGEPGIVQLLIKSDGLSLETLQRADQAAKLKVKATISNSNIAISCKLNEAIEAKQAAAAAPAAAAPVPAAQFAGGRGALPATASPPTASSLSSSTQCRPPKQPASTSGGGSAA